METATETEQEAVIFALKAADTVNGKIVTEPRPTKRTPTNLRSIAIAATLLLAMAGGTYWWLNRTPIEETEDSFVTGHIHQLGARVSGTVIAVPVQDNQHVQSGETLVKIDPKDFQNSLETAKAAAIKASWQALEAKTSIIKNTRAAESQQYQANSELASANAQVDRAKSIVSETTLGVTLAAVQIKQRQAELVRAASDYERYQSLVEDRAATTQAYEKAKQDKDVAESNLQAAQENYKQAKLRVEQAKQALLDAQSNVERAKGAAQSALAARAETESSKHNLSMQQAALLQAETETTNAANQLSYTSIVSPIAGRVGHKTVEVGQQIERGQALLSVVSDDKWIVANFKETQLSKMTVGQEVEIHIDALPQKIFKGHVESIAPASGAQFALLPPDNATGNFTKVVQRVPVKIVFEPHSIKGYENRLTPGMSARPEVHVDK
ncbi:MAG: HlyD family secretion protein [Candidatus Obscuribacterales bacterium]